MKIGWVIGDNLASSTFEFMIILICFTVMHLKPFRHVWRRWALSARVTRCMKSLNKVSRIWRASVLGTAQVLYDKHTVTLCFNHVLLRIPPLEQLRYSVYTKTNPLWLKSYQKGEITNIGVICKSYATGHNLN